MSFVVEQIKNNRCNIVFNNNKFRETYSLKSGEIIWRCLGRNCGATIRTDNGKTSIIVANDKHSGPHPVTMRSLGSPSASPLTLAGRSSSPAIPSAPAIDISNASTSSPATVTMPAAVISSVAVTPHGSVNSHAAVTPNVPVTSHAAVTPHVAVSPHVPVTPHVAISPHVPVTPHVAVSPHVPVASRATATSLEAVILPAVSQPSPAATSPVSPHAVITSPSLIIQSSPSAMSSPDPPTTLTNLLVENLELKRQISQLQQQVKVILDHSIESDTRLMEFTDEVFTDPTASKRIAQGDTTPTSADVSIQCTLPMICTDEQCAEYRALVQSLKTTVEVLEAEIQCLKTEARDYTCGIEEETSADWTTYGAKSVPIKFKNRYAVLSTVSSTEDRVMEGPFKTNVNVVRKKSNHRMSNKKIIIPKNNQPKSRTLHTPKPGKTAISFRSVIIKSDSHGRHLAGMIQDLVDPKTSVMGVVKPGASLHNVTSCYAPTPNSCSILIAGTNDLGNGRQNTIYRQLEQSVASRLGSTRLLVSTLPHRYDLPEQHMVNKNISVVNEYIKALVDKSEGVGLVDFNRIGRRFFTNHGLHLRMPGKRLLSKLILESIVKMDLDAHIAVPRDLSPSVSQRSPSMPLSLPFDTFAEAVKHGRTSPQRTSLDNRQTDEHYKSPSGKCFLGTPLHSKGLN